MRRLYFSLLCIFLLALLPAGIFFLQPENNEILGIPIPSDAENIHYKDDLLRFTVEFEASPASIEMFASRFCDGILHQGYDPFNAVVANKLYPNLYLIKADNYTYYSYSPNTSDAMWGNRCRGILGHPQIILVDKTNPTHHKIRFELAVSYDRTTVHIPTSAPHINYILPFQEVPLMVVGLAKGNNHYLLITDEICFEVGEGYYLESRRYKKFVEAEVKITVDDNMLADTKIETWRLAPTTETPNLFNYCVLKDWEEGVHKMTVEIIHKNGNSTSHELIFVVKPSDKGFIGTSYKYQ